MLCIEYDGPHKNRITLTRGDSATLKLKLYDEIGRASCRERV